MTTHMTTHTPGPWRLMNSDKEVYGAFEDDGRGWRVADLAWSTTNWRANARLIAAAPELLAALEEMMYYDDGGHRGDKARAAIAKAKGESA